MSYYVYHLIDPRTQEPFYVGKGQRRRIEAHEREAKDGSDHPKCDRIRQIWADGYQVTRRQVAQFADEQQAYDFEAQEIERIGLENLTNLCPGGGSPIESEPFSSRKDCRTTLKIVAKYLSLIASGRDIAEPWGAPVNVAVQSACSQIIEQQGIEYLKSELSRHGVNTEVVMS